ncbi:MAG: multidrug efflux RND transporter permease subunit [Gammaproteobacteria bacterium]|nr:multidrug efflux RND transporter permease subunit [Gammaproteobacteria bacterium]
MKFPHLFIERPRFAAVCSLLITIVGAVAYFGLPITQYPEIAPPTVVVSGTYPGANPEEVAETVATPLEQEINGVEGMLYMNSSTTSDGAFELEVTFELGTDLDTAQVLVENRAAVAESRLPEEVRQQGLITRKRSPDLMMVVHVLSPDGTYDGLYVSNYVELQIAEVLRRVEGVGDIIVFGAREYSMRIWMDPQRLASLNLTATDVTSALQGQNVQVAAGTLGQPPMPLDNAFQLTVNTQGRFASPEQFSRVIVKAGADGRLVRLGTVARVELGAQDYVRNSYLDGNPAQGIGVFQLPGGNALATADEIRAVMRDLSQDFPPGLAYEIAYDPTQFVAESINSVYVTIFEAVILVCLVIIAFLQSWRAAVIPIVAIPVALIGTFAVLAALGFSLNNLTLFGLALAVGIVVDDAIVVVENMERNLREGMSAREAAHKTMDEVGAALISIGLVLCAVFIPAAFIGGISGQFFQQFAVTIAAATIITTFVSLTLSPTLGALLLKKNDDDAHGFFSRLTRPFFRAFDRAFDAASRGYAAAVSKLVRHSVVVLVAFLILIFATAFAISQVPGGFIPEQDQGFLIVSVELPQGASLQRTDAVVKHADRLIRKTKGVAHVVGIAGFSGVTRATSPNEAAMFVLLPPFAERASGETATALIGRLQKTLSGIQAAEFLVIEPPAVRGLGTSGGFTMMVQDRGGAGLEALVRATGELLAAANQSPNLESVFTTFSTDTPRYYLHIDRTKAEMLNVPVENVFSTLATNLGSSYVNDFNLFGRLFRVTAQADAQYRLEPDDIMQLRARSDTGAMVPVGSLAEIRWTTGPDRVVRHNLYPAAEVQGSAGPGVSSGAGLTAMEQLAAENLPRGFDFEWVETAYQEREAGNTVLLVFPLSVLFVFLLLTAQYESWSLPLAIILIVPLCLLFAITGIWLRGMDNNILTQIGFVVLIGLACKNAVLIVEFARQRRQEGRDRFTAAVEAAQMRLRPVLMTSFAFILGVVPLMLAHDAGAEMRQVLGTTVFSGMLGVTFFGLLFTPVFYVVIEGFIDRSAERRARRSDAAAGRNAPAMDAS